MTSVRGNISQNSITPVDFLLMHPRPRVYSEKHDGLAFRYVCKYHNPSSKKMYVYGYVDIKGTEKAFVKVMPVRPRVAKHKSSKSSKNVILNLFKATFNRVFNNKSSAKKPIATCQSAIHLRPRIPRIQYWTKKEIEAKRESVWKPLTPMTLTLENCKTPKILKLPVTKKRQPKLSLLLAAKQYNAYKEEKKLEKRGFTKLSVKLFKTLSSKQKKDSKESVELEEASGNTLRLSPTRMNLSSLAIGSSNPTNATEDVQSTLTLAPDVPPQSNPEEGQTKEPIPVNSNPELAPTTSSSENRSAFNGFKNKIQQFVLKVTRRKN